MPVDDITYSDQLLEEKARKLTGQDVILDATETIGTDFQTVDPSIPAILVQKTSAGGAVRVTGLGRRLLPDCLDQVYIKDWPSRRDNLNIVQKRSNRMT